MPSRKWQRHELVGRRTELGVLLRCGKCAAGTSTGGSGAGGGAGGRGDDDEEYQVAGCLEGDAELFAPGNVVSPPVIGDWNNNEDWK